ncbi:phage protein GP20 [Roseibium sp. TrichSKD4]|uniref:major capsid protein n=1 Tax=Roseibium sp. TrichSKD4 TaxID=744980 RepID=UPI0001E56F52|nr:major capsid protein [Roseibium sp. TrichSKD4]EFO31341.1 phage protein GP20 [Roseibium sp. TrichSKD4]
MSEIFNLLSDDAFSMASMIKPVNEVAYMPHFLEKAMTFDTDYIRTGIASVDVDKDGNLAIIQTSERGTPAKRTGKSGKRTAELFAVPGLSVSDQVKAIELDGIRETGEITVLEQMQKEILKRFAKLRRRMALTKEFHRMGAAQGVLLDADGSVIYDFYKKFGIEKPAEIQFDFTKADLTAPCNAVVRAVQKGCKGNWTSASSVLALCGDEFWDKLTGHKGVKESYLNWEAATGLRKGLAANSEETGVFDTFRYKGIDWVNYRGQDDYTDDEEGKVGIPTNKARFLPRNVEGAFKKAVAPHPDLENINTTGREDYPLIVPDTDRKLFVELELYSYPLHLCALPGALQTGALQTGKVGA